MSALKVLEDAVSAEHHARARETAKVVYQRVSELLAGGEPPEVIYDALHNLYERHRSAGDSVMRDAFAEVLDWFEAEGPAQSA